MWHKLLMALAAVSFSVATAQAATTPTTDFTDNGDGTVSHKTTGLTWKRCAEGMAWSGSNCTGTAAAYTWPKATALTATFAGKSDWRLPTIGELVSIVEMGNYNPAINTSIFPGTPSISFWSALEYRKSYAFSGYYAWGVDFTNGSSKSIYTQASTISGAPTLPVRLVRGGQPLDSSGLYTPTSDFTVNADGSATHKKTGLTWKRCVEGQTWAGSTCSGTAQLYQWYEAMADRSDGWRLPNLNELFTIVEWSTTDLAFNTQIFPNTPSSYFSLWSSSFYSDPRNFSSAWGLNADGSSFTASGKTYVRLVRGGQASTVSQPDCLFNWAEKSYPTYFTPAGKTQSLDVYTYRQYTGNTYLGVSSKDNHVWAILGGKMMDAGAASQWYATAGCK